VRQIVVGVDGSPVSVRALEFAAGLVRDLRESELLVVFARHVWLAQPDDAAEDMFDDVLDDTERSILAQVADSIGEDGPPWRYETAVGRPDDVLRHVVEREHAHLLVVGHHNASPFTELVLGSVSSRLAQHVKVPLVLVP
jgi:nucleotide-binding universal stress UspA family protein